MKARIKTFCSAFIICSMTLLASCTSVTDTAGTLGSVVAEQQQQQAQLLEQQKQQQADLVARQMALVEEVRQKQLALIEENRLRVQNQSTQALAVKPSSIAGRDGVAAKPKPEVKQASVGGVSRAPGDITLNAPWKCVPSKLKAVIYEVSRRYGPVTVNSTHRSHSRNRRVGGARNSYHLRCQAVDFRVRGDGSKVLRFLRNHPHVGGLKRYRSGYFHIDTGPRRTWRG